MLGFKCFATARRVIAGVEAMLMLRNGQVSAVPPTDMLLQRAFITKLFASPPDVLDTSRSDNRPPQCNITDWRTSGGKSRGD